MIVKAIGIVVIVITIASIIFSMRKAPKKKIDASKDNRYIDFKSMTREELLDFGNSIVNRRETMPDQEFIAFMTIIKSELEARDKEVN